MNFDEIKKELNNRNFITLSTNPLMNLTFPIVGITIDTNGSDSNFSHPVFNRPEYMDIKYY